MCKIAVLIAEDEPLARSFLEDILLRESDLAVVGAVSDGPEAVASSLALQPDVLLLDLHLPGANGLEVLRQLAEAGARTHVLVLTVDNHEDAPIKAFRAGAKGFLSKFAVRQCLAEAIRAVAAGETWIDRETTSRVVEELRVLSRKLAQVERPDAALSEREKEVLCGIGRGLTNRQIAQELFLSERTVKGHASRLFEKLDLSNRYQAALFARRIGLVQDEGHGFSNLPDIRTSNALTL